MLSWPDFADHARHGEQCFTCNGEPARSGQGYSGGLVRVPENLEGSWGIRMMPCTCIIGAVVRHFHEEVLGFAADWFDRAPLGMPSLSYWDREALLFGLRKGVTLYDAGLAVRTGADLDEDWDELRKLLGIARSRSLPRSRAVNRDRILAAVSASTGEVGYETF